MKVCSIEDQTFFRSFTEEEFKSLKIVAKKIVEKSNLNKSQRVFGLFFKLDFLLFYGSERGNSIMDVKTMERNHKIINKKEN